MATTQFEIGSLIIPMDETYQNYGVFKAYGLAYALAGNGIHVCWVINDTKTYGAADFTASSTDIQSGAIITNHNYSGGPFIIYASDAIDALPIITKWQNDYPEVKVHRLTAVTSANIEATVVRPPRIAFEEANRGIMIGYLNAAGIPDSEGNPWRDESPDILSESRIKNGELFENVEVKGCRSRAYDIFFMQNSYDSNWKYDENSDGICAKELTTFINNGGMVYASGNSVSVMENVIGPLITTTGIKHFQTKEDKINLSINSPAYPSVQAVKPSEVDEEMPYGTYKGWLRNSVDYTSNTSVLAYFNEDGFVNDFLVEGTYGAGKIIYEGGYGYSTSLPYSKNPDGAYLRFLLDSILLSLAMPFVYVVVSPTQINQNTDTGLVFYAVNSGGSYANSMSLSITLASNLAYNANSASITPSSISGQTLYWDSTRLGNRGTGVILTFSAHGTSTSVGPQQAGSYRTDYFDIFNGERYSSSYCIPILVTETGDLPPEVTDYSFETYMNKPLSGNVTAVDENNDNLTYHMYARPLLGDAYITRKGYWIYVPHIGVSGDDYFSVVVIDNKGYELISKVHIKILPTWADPLDYKYSNIPWIYLPYDEE